MESGKQSPIENKLQRLEELLYQWKKDNAEQEKRLEQRLIKGAVKYLCIIVAALGAIWSVIELADWYCKKLELAQLAKSYVRAADRGYRQTRNPEAALKIINNALELTPDDPDLRYKQLYYQCHAILEKLPVSRSLYNAEDLKNLDILQVNLSLQKELSPDNGELYLLEALLYHRQGQYQKALSAVDKAVRYGAEYPYAETLRIQNVLALKQFEKAASIAEELLKKYPQNKYSHFALGMVFDKKQLYLKAGESYKKALDLAPDYIDAIQGIILCSASQIPRDYKTERDYCKKLIKLHPLNWRAYRQLVRSYIADGQYDLASLYLKKAERLFSEKRDLYVLQAELGLKQREFLSAETAILKAFEITPEAADIHRQLVSVYIASGKYSQAVRYNKITAAIAMERKNPSALNNAAWRFYLLGTEYDLAEKLSKQAIELAPHKSYYYGTYASLLFRKGEKQAALAAIDKAVQIADRSRKIVHLTEKAVMLLELNKDKYALDCLKSSAGYAADYYRLHLAWAEYYMKKGDLKEARKAVERGEKCSRNSFEKTELLLADAKIKAACGDWKKAETLQKTALEKIDNSFSEIRIAWQNYAFYCIKSGNKKEAEKAVAVLKTINSQNPQLDELEKLKEIL